MSWLVLAAVLVVEFSVALLLVQLLSRWIWVWTRWPMWALLVLLSAIPFAAARDWVQRNSSHIRSGDWSSEQDLFNLHAPYPTFRLLLFAPLAAIPILLALIGLASLLRWKSGGLKLLVWTITWRLSLFALATSLSMLVATLLLNDIWIRHSLHAMDRESRIVAARVAPPACDDHENAAIVLAEIGGSAELSQKGLANWSENIELLRDQKWSEYFLRNQNHADRIRQAANRPRCRFQNNWSDPNPLARAVDVDYARACVRLLSAEGHRALMDGKGELASDNARALRRIAELLAEDPRAIVQLVACATDGVANSLIEHLLYAQPEMAERVVRLTRKKFEFRESLPALAAWERAENYRTTAMAYLGLALEASDYKFPGHRQLTAAVLARDRLVFAGDDIRALRIIFDEIDVRSGAPDGTQAGTKDAMWFFEYKSGGAKIANRLFVDTFAAVMFRADTYRRLTDFAAEIARRGLINSSIEGAVENLIPDVDWPLDLFDRKPLKVTATDGGLVIYSVGMDGKDNDGAEERSLESREFDLTFCLGDAYRIRRLAPRIKDSDQIESNPE